MTRTRQAGTGFIEHGRVWVQAGLLGDIGNAQVLLQLQRTIVRFF